MLKLYGFAVSNYYNMVKLALLEKGLPFEEVAFFAGKTPEALVVSPCGKVPVLGVEQGYVNETSVILDYIEQTQPGPKLLPTDPFERAQVLAIAKEIELYIELPARTCYAEAFFGTQVPEAIKTKAKAELAARHCVAGASGNIRTVCRGRHPERGGHLLPVQRQPGLWRGQESLRPGPAGRTARRQGAAGAP